MLSYFTGSNAAEGNIFVCNGDFMPGFYAAMSMVESGKFEKVVCGVMNREDKYSQALEQRGCELRQWNVDDRRSMEKAMEGVERVCLMPLTTDKFMERMEGMIAAIKTANVKHLVYWTPLKVDEIVEQGHHFKYLPFLREAKRMVCESGVEEITICELAFPMQRLFQLSHYIQNRGVLPLPIGRGKFAPVSLRDCGLATANLLCSSHNNGNGARPTKGRPRVLTLTGPQLLSGTQLVERANRALQSEIEFEDVDNMTFRKILRETGEIHPMEIEIWMALTCLIRENRLTVKTDELAKLLEGKEITDVEVFFRNNADSFRPSGGILSRLAFKELKL